jgi:uncharacterized RDD family membrane protein YckC
MILHSALLLGVFVLGVIVVDVAAIALGGMLMPALIAMFVFYEPLMVTVFGATVGHRAMNLRVVDSRSGLRLGFLRAMVRFLLKVIVGVVSFVFMAVSRRHQALHDLAAGSVVIIHDRSRASEPQYVREADFVPPPGNVSALRRAFVILGYSFALFIAQLIPAALFVSEDCLVDRNCSSAEDTLSNIAGLATMLGIGGVIVLGWRGKLYGARSRSTSAESDADPLAE